MIRSVKVFGILLLATLAFVWTSEAQYPTDGPKPRYEHRSEYVVGTATECNVESGGTIQLGPTTIGGGTITYRNVGKQPIAAIRMGLDYRTASGNDISNPGDIFFVSVRKQGESWFKPGEKAPVNLFAVNVAAPGDRILSVSPRVHAVVFADGSTCGTDGGRMMQQYQAKLTSVRNGLLSVLQVSKRLGADTFRQFIQNEESATLPGGRSVSLRLKHYLLDGNGNLLPDAAGQIQTWIDNLDRPFRTDDQEPVGKGLPRRPTKG